MYSDVILKSGTLQTEGRAGRVARLSTLYSQQKKQLRGFFQKLEFYSEFTLGCQKLTRTFSLLFELCGFWCYKTKSISRLNGKFEEPQHRGKTLTGLDLYNVLMC